MLQAAGLIVHLIPSQTEDIDQKPFPQPVAPDHRQRNPLSFLSERGSLVV